MGASAAADEQAILRARENDQLGPMRLRGPMRVTYLTGRHRSTIWKDFARHGVSHRRRSAPSQTTCRYELTEAGALLHVDAFEVPKFSVPGRWAAGRRAERRMTRQAGKTIVIGVIDGYTRLACGELHGTENAITVSAMLRRAAQGFEKQGCGPPKS